MMESSQFSDVQNSFEGLEHIDTKGATCDTYRVKIYGKLHFLKRLKEDFTDDIRYKEALRKEFETGYRLEHPNLVRYISLNNDSILMEYVDGDTLTQRLANHPEYFKSRNNTQKFIRQLLDVLGYLHSHQVLHLDLKPDNILLTRINDDVKLIDLGFCYTDTFEDSQGHTDSFAAPEQLAGKKVDVRTDIYSFGKILELLPNLYKYNKVIARCTAQVPDARYRNIRDLQDAIFPRKSYLKYLLLAVLLLLFTLVFFIKTNNYHHSTKSIEQRVESSNPKPSPVRHVKEKIVEKSYNYSTDVSVKTDGMHATMPIERSENFCAIQGNLSEDEIALLSKPELHVATDEEFEVYKQKLISYYAEVNAFLDDTINMKLFPSHISYLTKYEDLIYEMRESMKNDKWFFPLYNSPMNPICSYTQEYKDAIERKAFINGNKLP